MKRYKKYRIQISPTKLRNFFFISKKNFLRIILNNYWEQFLSTYQLSKKKILAGVSLPFGAFEDFQRQKNHQSLLLHGWNKKAQLSIKENVSRPGSSPPSRDPVRDKATGDLRREGQKSFFYLKKEKFSQYNYLILANLVDYLGDTQIVQSRVRNFIKIQTKYLELEKLFQIKIFKNSIFLSWISYLLIEQIDQFIKMTSSFLRQFQFISLLGPLWKKKMKIEIQNTGNFLSLTYQDFLMLKWYQKKIHTWFYQVLIKTKETKINQSFNKIFKQSPISSVIEMGNKLIYDPQNEINNTFQTLEQKKKIAKKEKGNNLSLQESNKILEQISVRRQKTKNSKQKYLKFIKKILLKNKVTTQIEVIKQLNQIVRNWDTFAINNITKKKARKLNLFLYQLLWYWGFARHRRQKAKWIKNRYWFFRPLYQFTGNSNRYVIRI
jgi:hypothetical protein